MKEPNGQDWADRLYLKAGIGFITVAVLSLWYEMELSQRLVANGAPVAFTFIGIGMMLITGIGRLNILLQDVQDIRAVVLSRDN